MFKESDPLNREIWTVTFYASLKESQGKITIGLCLSTGKIFFLKVLI